jgi:hypothetical protein
MLFGLAVLLTVSPSVPSAFAEENEEPRIIVDPIAPAGSGFVPVSKSLAAAAAAAQAGVPIVATIDVLALYTPARRKYEGGEDAVRKFLERQVAEANLVEANSGTGVQYRLLDAREIAYVESGELEAAFTWLSKSKEVAALRDGAGADLVSLFVDYTGGGAAGLACGSADPDCPWSVMIPTEFSNGFLAAHEWGHNRELDHDVKYATPDSYPNNHGNFWKGSTGAYRDVMAYPYECWDELAESCPGVPLYASPAILFDGVPTGVKGVSEAAEVARLTGPIVAGYRTPEAVTRLIARWFPAERRMTIQVRVSEWRPGAHAETVQLHRGPLKNGQPQGRPFATVTLADGAGSVTVTGWRQGPAFISGKTSRGTTFQRFVRSLG